MSNFPVRYFPRKTARYMMRCWMIGSSRKTQVARQVSQLRRWPCVH